MMHTGLVHILKTRYFYKVYSKFQSNLLTILNGIDQDQNTSLVWVWTVWTYHVNSLQFAVRLKGLKQLPYLNNQRIRGQYWGHSIYPSLCPYQGMSVIYFVSVDVFSIRFRVWKHTFYVLLSKVKNVRQWLEIRSRTPSLWV